MTDMIDIITGLCLLFSASGVILIIVVLIRLSTKKREKLDRTIREEFRLIRDESAKAAKDLREEVTAGQKAGIETIIRAIEVMGKSQKDELRTMADQIKELTTSNESRIESVRSTIELQLRNLRETNEKKLDQMRETVDEKLQSTLEKRLGESFHLVSMRLEAVQRGLGEMKNLATGVGDLKRVLTNVKVRGTWGEVQLGALLEQILTPDQYDANVQIRKNSRENVEFAIRLPGRGDDPGSFVWLPIDSKFPQEDYLKLVEATDRVDLDAVQKATASLVRTVNNAAKEIHDKYIDPPNTTDFAIMFLPTESLYAEVLRQPGQLEKILQTHRVVISGPTTLSAILSSLRLGFRTLAIEKRSSEVWKILSAVKTEFGKFGEILEKLRRQLRTASNTLDQTGIRTRAMRRKLRDVEKLPFKVSAGLLGLAESDSSGNSNDDDEVSD